MGESVVRRWVIRIFNGSLQGAEFILSQPRTLFVVGPQNTFCHDAQSPSMPPDALYIPVEEGGQNFEVIIDDDTPDGLTIRLPDTSTCEELFCTAQTIEQVGFLRIAVRPVDDTWAPGFLSGAEQDNTQSPVPRRVPTFPWWTASLLGILMIGCMAGAGWMSRSSAVDDVQHLIKGAISESAVLPGRDHQLYVFAQSERDAQWERQVFERNPQASRVQVLTASQESLRLGKLIRQSDPDLAWHRIDLSSPSEPRLLVSTQRTLLTPTLEQRLRDKLLEAAPYALSVLIEGLDDEFVAANAESGLKQLAVPYQRLAAGADNLTFTLQGSLGDAQLEAARRYIADFYRQWGDRYVHFAVELKDDWLKGKSFQYGPEGYVKMTPSSWYFSQPDMR